MSKIKIKCAAENKIALPKHNKATMGSRVEKPKTSPIKQRDSQGESLDTDERRDFADCETKIENGLDSTVEVANAFYIIQSKKLYRANYGSFQAYCEDRWNLSRQQGYRLAEMGALNAQLAATGDVIPSENQARLLKQVPKEKLAKVMSRAKEIAGVDKPAFKDYQAAKDEICPADASGKKTKGNVVKLPTWQNAISTTEVRKWAVQALENLKNNTKRDETIELLNQIVAALTILDNTAAQKAA